MPILNITQEDTNRLKKVDRGWYLSEITNVTAKQSKKGGLNFTYEFKVVDENTPMNGRYGYRIIPSEYPGLHFPIISAAMKISTDSIEMGGFDTDTLIGKRLFVKYEEEVNPTNQQVNSGVPTAYSPEDKVPVN
jgi:hypothetical protein